MSKNKDTGELRPDQPSKRRDLYAPVLDALMPGQIGEARELRLSILLLKDMAGKSLASASEEASMVLASIQSIGLLHAFATDDVDVLRRIRYAMLRLTTVAAQL